MAEETNNVRLLELAPAELVVPLKVAHAGRTYRVRHFLRAPGPADWFAYEAALELAVEELSLEPDSSDPDSDEPGFRLHVRSTDAALELWTRLARRVEGYALSPVEGPSASGVPPAQPAGIEASPLAEPSEVGAAAFSARLKSCPDEGWRALIPLAHKEAAVRALTLVGPAQLFPDSTNNDSPPPADAPWAQTNHHFPLFADEIPIVLEAAVAGVAYPRLVHCFRPPSVEDERAYRRLQSETLIVRGSRHPRTLIPARLPALVRLYDRLILSVEGYSFALQPLASRTLAIQHMDVWHKRVAVLTLFGDLSAEVPPREVAQGATNPAQRDEELPAAFPREKQ